MSIQWTTSELEEWEKEIPAIELQYDKEYINEQKKLLEEFNDDMTMVDQLYELYEDMARVPRFCRFSYKDIDEEYIDNVNFRCSDPLGLFYHLVDSTTFNIFRFDVFQIDETEYRPFGKLNFELKEIKTLFRFAERYTTIKGSFENEPKKRKKFVVWVVSRMIEFLV
jgi:hypothetical protein